MAAIGKISEKSDHEVEWTIEDFFSYTTDDSNYISPFFSISGFTWFLCLYPNGQTSKNSDGRIFLFLYLDGAPPEPVGAWYNFGVKTADGMVEKFHSDLIWLFEGDGVGYGHDHFLERSALLQRKAQLAPNDSLTLYCTLRIDKYFESPSSVDILSLHIADLFTSKKGCDATLKVMGVEFTVHKLILSARSPVFAAMFSTDMKEKRTGLVEIEDCDPETFREFLMYLYSGKVQKSYSNVSELLKIADKYDVQDLKSYCLMSIMANLTVENVLDAFILGRQLDKDALTVKTQKLFNENFKTIVFTDQWDVFLSEHTLVANELLNGMARSLQRK